MKNEVEPLIRLEDFCKLNNADKQLFLSVTTEEEKKNIGIEMKTIKLDKDITIGQVSSWIKKGCIIEVHGFSMFIMTDNATLETIINKANRGK